MHSEALSELQEHFFTGVELPFLDDGVSAQSEEVVSRGNLHLFDGVEMGIVGEDEIELFLELVLQQKAFFDQLGLVDPLILWLFIVVRNNVDNFLRELSLGVLLLLVHTGPLLLGDLLGNQVLLLRVEHVDLGVLELGHLLVPVDSVHELGEDFVVVAEKEIRHHSLVEASLLFDRPSLLAVQRTDFVQALEASSPLLLITGHISLLDSANVFNYVLFSRPCIRVRTSSARRLVGLFVSSFARIRGCRSNSVIYSHSSLGSI